MVTFDDIKREIFENLHPGFVYEPEMIPLVDLGKAIDLLHSQGLLMMWNTDMDSAPRGDCEILICGKRAINTDSEPVVDKDQTVSIVKIYESGDYGDVKYQIPFGTEYSEYVVDPTAWMPLPKVEAKE